MSYKVKIDINDLDFPEMGSIFGLKAYNEIGNKKAISREEYNALVIKSNERVEVPKNATRDKFKDKVSQYDIEEFVFEKGVINTFKFLGMDIDKDYNAVIKMSNGRVIVGNLCNVSEIRSFTDDININSVSENNIKQIVTALKMGGIYDLVKLVQGMTEDTALNKTIFNDCFKVPEEITGKIKKTAVGGYTSVILALVHKVNKKRELINNKEEPKIDTTTLFLSAMLCYWETLLNLYERTLMTLSKIDLWGYYNKKLIGKKEFNSRLPRWIKVFDQNGNAVDEMVAIEGVAEQKTSSDDRQNIVHGCLNGITKINGVLLEREGSIYGSEHMYFDTMLYGCVQDGIVEESDKETCYALSIVDALGMTDKIETYPESYDLKNESEKAKYIQSVVDTINKNLKEYKNTNNETVIETLEQLATANELVQQKPISIEDIPDTGTFLPVANTLSNEQNDIVVDISKMLKVVKILNKLLDNINKCFN